MSVSVYSVRLKKNALNSVQGAMTFYEINNWLKIWKRLKFRRKKNHETGKSHRQFNLPMLKNSNQCSIC